MSKRKIREYRATRVMEHVKELHRLRKKAGYAKCSAHKLVKLRRRMRYQLAQLRGILPNQGTYYATDPNTWEVIYTTEADRRRAYRTWLSFMHYLSRDDHR